MKKIVTLLLIISISASVYASNAGDWLEIAPDARAIGMGGAQIAGANSAYAPFWNPASRSRMTEIGSTFASLMGQANYQYVGAMSNFSFGRLGLAYMRLSFEGLQKTALDNNQRPISSGSDFSVLNSALMLSYSGRVNNSLELGITGKFINNTIENATASGLAIDLGLQYLIHKNLQLAAVIYNILDPVIIWSTRTEEAYPAKAKIGMRALLFNDLVIEADADIMGYQKAGIHIGGEYWIDNVFALRAGYDKDVIALGIGVNFEGFKFDYAYSMASTDYMEATSRFSLGYIFAPQQNLLAKADIRRINPQEVLVK